MTSVEKTLFQHNIQAYFNKIMYESAMEDGKPYCVGEEHIALEFSGSVTDEAKKTVTLWQRTPGKTELPLWGRVIDGVVAENVKQRKVPLGNALGTSTPLGQEAHAGIMLNAFSN